MLFHVKTRVTLKYFVTDCGFKGFSMDTEMPYSFQNVFVKEVLAEISWNFTKFTYINSSYFLSKKL